MCCFTGPIFSVSATNIFAREAADGRQHIAYSMTVSMVDDLAMILPLPVPEGSTEDAVTVLDLSRYPELFDDLVRAYPKYHWLRRPGPGRAGSSRVPLSVVDVGDFEASFVPSIADFARLDRRFRLPTEIWSQIPGYERFGFGVFKLKRGRQRVHPIAFTFPRANPDALFFPTVHIHDGQVHATAHFDHALFCQRGPSTRRHEWPGEGWERASAARNFIDIDRAGGLIDGTRHLYRRRIEGRAPNQDIYVEA